MKKNLMIAAILTITFVPLMLVTQTLATVAQDGPELFASAKCNTCHDVSSAGIEAKMKSEKMKGPDLTGVTARHDAAWIVKYVKKEENIDGNPHKASFKGSDEELAALVDWLSQQK